MHARALRRHAALAAACLSLIIGPETPAGGAEEEIAGAQRTVLNNGLELVTVPRPGVPLAAAVAIVRAGLSYETPDVNGVSHMLEHLLFNGTTSRTQEALYADLDSRGIVHNAHTGIDGTMLFMLGPREALAAMLEIESDMLFRSTFPPEKLEKEREIVVNEIARDMTQDTGQVEAFAAEVLYQGSPCAMPVLGTETTIRGLARDSILAYHRARFSPRSTTLILMGDIDPAGALDAARETFGALGAGQPGSTDAVPRCQPVGDAAGKVHARKMATAARHVVLAADAPALGEPLHAGAVLLSAVLEAGFGEAANRRLPPGAGRILDASIHLDSHRGGGLLEVTAALDPNIGYAEAARALLQEMEARLKVPVDPSALADRKVAERVRLAILEERPHFFAIDRAALVASCGWRCAAEARTRVAAVAPVDVAALASAYADPTSWAVLYAGQDADRAGSSWPAGPPDGAASAVEEPLEAQARAIVPVEFRQVLPNGLTLLVKSIPGSGVFGAQVTARGRAANEPQGKAGIADLLHRLAGTATRTRDAAALERDLARIGASLKVTDDPEIPYDDADTTPEFSFLRIETLDDFAEEALSLLAEMIREPSIDQPSLARQRGIQSARARQAAMRPSERAKRILLGTLLGPEHALASPPFGTEASLETITPLDLAAFHEAYFAPSNLIAAVVSSLPAPEILNVATRTLGALEPAARRPAGSPPPLKARPAGSVREPSGAKQAYILEGALLNPRRSEVAALAAAAAVLSRRISFELRERRGLSYSLGAGVEPLGDKILLSVRMGTRPDQVNEALAGIDEMLLQIVSKPPTAQEIAQAVRIEGVRVMMRATSRANQAAMMGLEELRSGTPGASLRKDLSEPDPAAVARAAKAYFSPRRLTKVVLE